MNRFFITLCLAILSVNFSFGQMLWSIEREGHEGRSYLFGTYHLGDESKINNVKGFQQAFSDFNTVAVEVVLPETSEEELMLSALNYMAAPSDSTAIQLLSTEQVDSVFALVSQIDPGSVGIIKEMMNVLKPIVVVNSITSILMKENIESNEFDIYQTMDFIISSRAVSEGKKLVGLETPEEQLEMLYNTPISRQIETLLELIRNIDETTEMSNRLTSLMEKAYTENNFRELEEFVLSNLVEFESINYNIMLTDRNTRWLDRLEKILEEDNIMIAVGAAHLMGKDGLIERLRSLGYVVSPILN